MQIRMPNGMDVHGPSRGEVRLLFDEIFDKKVYLQHGIELGEGDVVFDIGANLGFFSLFLGQTLRDFTVHAFEPVSEIFEGLRRNTSRLGEKVVLYNLGLSDHEGSAVFSYYPRLASFSTSCPDRLANRWVDLKDILMQTNRAQRGNRRPGWRLPGAALRSWCVNGLVYYASRKKDRVCRLTTLSSIIAQRGIERIDLLKIDVEGSEWDVLRGIEETDWPKIRQVVMEVHDPEHGVEAVSTWLGSRGYEVAVDPATEDRRSPLFMLYARRRPGGEWA
jgi:31-O-methyltransferase